MTIFTVVACHDIPLTLSDLLDAWQGVEYGLRHQQPGDVRLVNHQELVDWLFANGGPAIRYRTATELMPPSSNVDIGQLREELCQSKLAKTWLERLVPSALFNDLHGSKATAFENVMGKLTELGLRRGVPEFEQRTMPYRSWLKDNAEGPPTHVFDRFAGTLIAAFLARAGYVDEPAVGEVLKGRLATVYDFARKGSYDIYVDPTDYPRMPRIWRDGPLVNPALTRDGNSYLPSIYDIIGLAAYLPECGTEDDWAKADTIVNYILNAHYQKLAPGYGILRTENVRYYSMGWDVKLPGFFGAPSDDVKPRGGPLMTPGAFVQRLALMGQFPAARSHPWFINGLNHLHGFQTENGTCLFPRSYLAEKPSGYWVTGARMGLEENRRTGLAIELESTFWMAMLQSWTSAGVETSSL